MGTTTMHRMVMMHMHVRLWLSMLERVKIGVLLDLIIFLLLRVGYHSRARSTNVNKKKKLLPVIKYSECIVSCPFSLQRS